MMANAIDTREQLVDVVRDLKIRIANERLSERPDHGMADMRDARHWRVKLYRRVDGKDRQLTCYFSQGSGHTKEPTAADVLSCIASDAQAGYWTFKDFCAEFGYDTDSRKAEATWKACAKMTSKVRQFLGTDFDRVLNAEH